MLDAALLGNRYNLSQSASERFREGGTFHVLVISGLHISFLGGLVFLVVRRLTKRRLVQFVLARNHCVVLLDCRRRRGVSRSRRVDVYFCRAWRRLFFARRRR